VKLLVIGFDPFAGTLRCMLPVPQLTVYPDGLPTGVIVRVTVNPAPPAVLLATKSTDST
jgi:hypothetical protein